MNRFANKIIVLLLVVSLFSVIGCESTCPLKNKSECPLKDKSKCPLKDKSECPLKSKSECPLKNKSECPLKKKCKAEWQNLFDGKTLNGWKKIGGEGQFYVDNGAIVGKAITTDPPSTFLCTEKQYGDFILEYEAIIDEALNSGVQIRSHVLEEDRTTPHLAGNLKRRTANFKAGIVWGYQIEMDPTERAWSGGLYEEGGRGWLYHLEGCEDARKAFKNGQWNHFRVEAKGPSFKSWVNDIPVTDALDWRTKCGFGLQLHYCWKEEQLGKTVQWRNIRIKVLD